MQKSSTNCGKPVGKMENVWRNNGNTVEDLWNIFQKLWKNMAKQRNIWQRKEHGKKLENRMKQTWKTMEELGDLYVRKDGTLWKIMHTSTLSNIFMYLHMYCIDIL